MFSQIISPNGNNLFYYNGAADVTFKYAERGAGGRAFVHDDGNILTLNYQSDFAGGTRIGSGTFFKDGGNSYVMAGNFGIGTYNPQSKLQIGEFNNGGTSKLSIPGVYNFEEIKLGQYGNGQNGLEMITHTDQTKSFGVRLFAGTDTGVNGLLFQTADPVVSAQGLTYTSRMMINLNGNVGIGTLNPTSKLTVAGNINAREVKVTVDAGADFVFEKGYKLPSLETVDQFIIENKHLPEIASAQKMQKEGINLSEMNIKLLQKIEEMTLYIIEMKKDNDKQNEKIKALENKLKKKEDE